MSFITQPSKQQFEKAVDAVSHIVQQENKQLDIKKGSAIRQLVVRPFAYCYAYVINMIQNWISQSSLKTLQKSIDTNNQLVDTIASNFFVERKEGSAATGYVNIITGVSTYSLYQNTKFIIDGHVFYTEKAIIVTNDDEFIAQDTIFIKAVKIKENLYSSNIPVIAEEVGILQIPADVQVECSATILKLQKMQLISPITGGRSVQTDADLIQRCKYSIRNSIGTLDSIKQRFLQYNLPVISCNALDSSSPGCFRSRLNNNLIALPGVVDLYVKVYNQALIQQLFSLETEVVNAKQLKAFKIEGSASTWSKVEIKDTKYCSILDVLSVTDSEGQLIDSIIIFSYTDDEVLIQQLGTDQPPADFYSALAMHQMSYRLSSKQKTIIYVQKAAKTPINIKFKYTPYIKEIDTFINSSQHKFIGLNIMTKAAVPVTTRVTVSANITSASQEYIQEIKCGIASCINSMQVGDAVLNMDVISQKIQKMYPDVRLRVPYYIVGNVPTVKGDQVNVHSNTGVLDLTLCQNKDIRWPSQVCYFSTAPSFIDIKVD